MKRSGFKCPKCGSSMKIKLGRNGKFLSCTRYPDCDGALTLDGTEFKKDTPIGNDPATGLPIFVKNYAARVQEMLRQYVRAARGRIELNVTDPRPDTPAEERAMAAGLNGQNLPNGETFVLGLVATLFLMNRYRTEIAPANNADVVASADAVRKGVEELNTFFRPT